MKYLISSSNISEFGGVELEICLIAEALICNGHSVTIVSKGYITALSMIKTHFEKSENDIEITSAVELILKRRYFFSSLIINFFSAYAWIERYRGNEIKRRAYEILNYHLTRKYVNNFWYEEEGKNIISTHDKVLLVATPNNWNVGLIDECYNKKKDLYWRMTQQAVPDSLSNKYFSDGIKKINSVNGMIVHSKNNAQLMKKYWNMTIEPIIIDQFANNEIDLLMIKESELHEDFIIGTLSRLDYEKGIDAVVNAIFQLKGTIPNIKLLIGGDGPELMNLQKLVDKRLIRDKVTFLRRIEQNEVAKFFEKINLFIMASRGAYESGPFTAIEAMAAGVPIISTDVGAMSSRLEGMDEFIVEPNDVLGIKNGVEKIYDMYKSGSIKEYKATLRQRYIEKYSKQAITEQYLSVLE